MLKLIKLIRKHPVISFIVFLMPLLTGAAAIKSLFFSSSPPLQKNQFTTPVIIFNKEPIFTDFNMKGLAYFEVKLPQPPPPPPLGIPKSSVVFIKDYLDPVLYYNSIDTGKTLNSIANSVSDFKLLHETFYSSIKLNFKNTSDRPLTVIGVVGASRSIDTSIFLIRDRYYKKKVDTTTIPTYDIMPNRIVTLLPDSTLEILFPAFSLPLPFDSVSHNSVLHFLLWYKDANNNFYDSYYSMIPTIGYATKIYLQQIMQIFILHLE